MLGVAFGKQGSTSTHVLLIIHESIDYSMNLTVAISDKIVSKRNSRLRRRWILCYSKWGEKIHKMDAKMSLFSTHRISLGCDDGVKSVVVANHAAYPSSL